MKKYISIIFIFLYSFALAQDVYPNFSSPKKQFKFEKERIYINEVEEKEQIIEGGGSEFNYLWLHNKDLPFYYQAPIETRFKYISEFNIIINKNEISETEFLNHIGLKDEAENYLIKQLEKYKNTKEQITLGRFAALSFYANDDERLSDKGRKDIEKLRKKYGYFLLSHWIIYPTIGASISLLLKLPSEPSIGILTLGLTFTKSIYSIWFGSWTENITLTLKRTFIYEQQLSNDQIKSLSESYNRQVYKEIQSQP